MEELINKIFNIKTQKEFEEISLDVFRFQYYNNKVYNHWSNLMRKSPDNVKNIFEIPFLPISFFKTHNVVSFQSEPIHFFKSSGTTNQNTSKHYIYDLNIYEKSFKQSFEEFFSPIENYCFCAILPNYSQQGNSSLIYMINNFINKSKYKDSGFYNQDIRNLIDVLKDNERKNIKTILFGVTYALMDLIEIEKLQLKNTIVFETGGMKGRRKEMIRKELHQILCKGLGVKSIASEYGMCELFSQAYSKGEGIFKAPSQMNVLVRDIYDALSYVQDEKTGGLNIIDLSNIYSCSFIATEDLGKRYKDGTFELLGRIDNTIIRGCNLMYED